MQPQGVNDKLSGPSAAPRPAMTQEITARDLLAVDAPPEGMMCVLGRNILKSLSTTIGTFTGELFG